MVRTGPKENAFTGDGRLLTMRFSRYARPEKSKGPPGVQWVGVGVGVWDTQTGKVLKIWDRRVLGEPFSVAFNPARPLLAVLEKNDEETRLGLWDFAAEVGKK